MSKRDLITKDFALHVVHRFASMQTWSKEKILSEIDRKINKANEDVVRCKDCRFCKKHTFFDGINMCTNEDQWDTDCYPLVYDTDFCSYGERKEQE